MGKPTTANRRTVNGSRYYNIDGEMYPSVTSILGIIDKPALKNWIANEERKAVIAASADLYQDLMKLGPDKRMSPAAYEASLSLRIGKAKAAERISSQALNIGTGAHAMIEHNIKKQLGLEVGPEPKITDESMWAFMAADDWFREVNMEPIFIEEVIYSRKFKYAGTMDLLAKIDYKGRRVLALIDFKTSKAIYKESHAQAAAYIAAVNEMGHGPVEVGYVLRLPKITTDPKPEPVEVTNLRENFVAFLHAMGLFNWVNKEAA